MKCSKCGHRARTIGAMAKHYRKKHPGAMKARVSRVSRAPSAAKATGYAFCPHCGGKL